MDERRYGLREFVDADIAGMARIWSRNDPDWPVTEREVRDLLRLSDGTRFVRYRRAVVDLETNEIAATGGLWQSAFFYDPKFAFAGVMVDPEHQHRGIARRLFEDLEAAARGLGLDGMRTNVRADQPRSVRFFEVTGFRETRRMWVSRLDVRELPADLPPRSPARWAEDGIVFTTLAEEGADRPEVRDRLYRLYLAVAPDLPGESALPSSTREEFLALAFEGAHCRPETMFVARAGDDYVAFSLLFRHEAEPDVLHVMITGTRPDYRGRGLAGELKRRSIEFARSGGFRYIQTDNDSQNERIWSINRQLGFRQFRVTILGEKRLPA